MIPKGNDSKIRQRDLSKIESRMLMIFGQHIRKTNEEFDVRGPKARKPPKKQTNEKELSNFKKMKIRNRRYLES